MMAWIEKNTFITLLFAGSFVMLFLRLIGAQIVSIMPAALCIYAYYRIAKRDYQNTHNPDNIYYMGFLFTLAALALALMRLFLFDTAQSNQEERIYELIGSFGIALISTILGILFRILLLDHYGSRGYDGGDSMESIENERRKAMQNLISAAIELRSEINQTTSDTQTFLEAIRGAVQQVTKTNKQIFKRMEESSEIVSAHMEAAAQNLVDSASRMSTLMEESGTKLSEQLQKSTSDLHDRAAQMSTEMAGQLDTVVSSIAQASEEAHKPINELASQHLKRLDEFVQEVGKSQDAMQKQMEEYLRTQTESLQEASENMVNLLSSSAESVSQSMNSALEPLDKLAQRQIERFDKYEEEAKAAANVLTESMQAASENMVNVLSSSVEAVSQSIEGIQEPLNKLTQQQIERFTKYEEEAKAAGDVLTQKLEGVADELSGSITQMSTRVSGRLEESLLAAITEIGSTTEGIKVSIQAALTALQGIVGQLSSAGENTEALAGKVGAMIDKLGQLEGEMGRAGQALSQTSQEFATSLTQATEVTPKYTEHFERLIATLGAETKEWEDMTQKVRTSLIGAVESLTATINKADKS